MAEQDQYNWISQITQKGPQASTITIRVNPRAASDITQRLEPYKNFPTKFAPALAGVADYITGTAIPRIFKTEGPGWPSLAKRTQRERAALGYDPQHPILIRSGDLYRELTSKSHPKHIEVITTGKNARVRVGGSSEKFIRNQAGNKFYNIPSRPMIPGTGYVPVDPGDQARINQIITDAILQEMKQ